MVPRWRWMKRCVDHNPEISVADCRDREALAAHCARLKIAVKPGYGWGKLLLEIFEKTVEGQADPAHLHHPLPGGSQPLARESDTSRASPTASNCSSAARNWPTASPN
jgi:lysyl-tRNA synthetase class 2